MKTYEQITSKLHRVSMRESALRYRLNIHPKAFEYGTDRRFAVSTEAAMSSLENAIAYRDMDKGAS